MTKLAKAFQPTTDQERYDFLAQPLHYVGESDKEYMERKILCNEINLKMDKQTIRPPGKLPDAVVTRTPK